MTLTVTLALSIVAALVGLASALFLHPGTASAHCDTMEGPAVKDGQRALQTGNVNVALKWVHQDGAEELGQIFEKAIAVRGLGDQAREVADQWFLENMIRIHRAGEGAPYTGIKPVGAPVDERVRAADAAIESGSLEELSALVPAEQHAELEKRFAQVIARKDFPVDDVAAGRDYLDAYVNFFHLAEGHGHDEHSHAHDEHSHAHDEHSHAHNHHAHQHA